jgi:phospholipase/carboxylesterase
VSAIDSLGFVHRYRAPDHDAPAGAITVLALHGTGGDESDLLPLARHVAPGAGILSPRGQVLEHGMPRFFRRLAEGVFDEPDLIARTAALATFVRDAATAYRFDPTTVVALGFSNGANIAGGLLLLHPGTLHAAALIRPMVPLTPHTLPSLQGIRVLISAGLGDSIVPRDNPERLAALLRSAGALVEMQWQPAGHALAPHEADVVRQWMATTVQQIAPPPQRIVPD